MELVKRIFQARQRFHDDTNGNAMLFVVLVLFTLVCFFVFTIHVGQRFTNKVEMQNATDAAVLSGAIWKARGFNLVSILNVSMSECLALIIMFKAFDSTLTITKIAHRINLAVAKACCEVPYTKAVCCPWKVVLEEVYGEVLLPAYTTANNLFKRTWKSPKVLWKLIKILKKVSKVLSAATASMAYLDASIIAEANGASALGDAEIGDVSLSVHAVLWPIQLKLPVVDEKENFQEELCPHTKKGGDGYKNYLCYNDAFDIEVVGVPVDSAIETAWSLLSLIFPFPVLTYEAMKEYHYDELCSESGSSQDMNDYLPTTVQCDICSRERGNSVWVGERIQLSRGECDDRWKIAGTESTPLTPLRLTGGRRPSGIVLENGVDDTYQDLPGGPNDPATPCRVCNLEIRGPNDGIHPTFYFADIWTLKECKIEIDEEEVNTETQNNDDDKTPPLTLADDWEDRVKYTSLVFKRENTVDSSHLLGFDGRPILSLKSDMSGEMITYGEDGNSELRNDNVKIPKRTWAVARAVVYVPDPGQADLFNQNWHAKLAPVDVKGIPAEFLGLRIPLPEELTDLMNDTADEVWTH